MLLVTFASLDQLRRFVCEMPINKDYEFTANTANQWDKFQCVELVENHRQGADHENANLLNRVRTDDQTEVDNEILTERV